MKKDNYKELKEEWDRYFKYFNKQVIDWDTNKDTIWSFILKEVIPMAEKKGREEEKKEFMKIMKNPKPQYATKKDFKELLKECELKVLYPKK